MIFLHHRIIRIESVIRHSAHGGWHYELQPDSQVRFDTKKWVCFKIGA